MGNHSNTNGTAQNNPNYPFSPTAMLNMPIGNFSPRTLQATQPLPNQFNAVNGSGGGNNLLFMSTPTAGGDSNINFSKRLGLGSNLSKMNQPGSFMGQALASSKLEQNSKAITSFSHLNAMQ